MKTDEGEGFFYIYTQNNRPHLNRLRSSLYRIDNATLIIII